MTPDPITSLPPDPLTDLVIAGEPRAMARAISVIEDDASAGAAIIARLYPHTGRAYLIGITGAPGVGKSTLVDRLVVEARRAGATVGVVAVDPTSPFSGGAILGDRVRMSSHADDAGVFVRSMATRGHLGGLAAATADAALVLDAAGKDVVIIETVGVGQDEIEIVRTADVTLVLLVPGTGDEVQAQKAGIMEIADIFVVNKADREGADHVVNSVTASVSLRAYAEAEWRPTVLKTEATTGAGVPELWKEIRRFREHESQRHAQRRKASHQARVRSLLAQRLLEHVEKRLAPGEFDRLIDDVTARRTDPYSAAASLMNRALDV